MASYTLSDFFNPLGNGDSEITGLMAPNTTYPLTLDPGNSYSYAYSAYVLNYDSGSDRIRILDAGNPTVVYAYNTSTARWECESDTFGRPSVLATYFTTPGLYIYIRPVVATNQIRFNWNSNASANSYILSCTSTDGGGGGGEVNLTTATETYTYTGLTYGKTYEGAINTSNASSGIGPSTIYRTVMTGDPPEPPTSIGYTSTLTTISFSWSPPVAAQTPAIGWYVITDSNTTAQYNTRFYTTNITIPFDDTPHTYEFQSVSDTGYSTKATLSVP